MMKLYSYYRSSAAYRVRIALALKGVQTEYLPVNLLKGENRSQDYGELNPQKLVPVLEADGRRITQSLAILEYLEERFPEPAILPKGAAERAYVRSLALLIACEIHPVNNLRVLHYLTGALNQSDAVKQGWYAHWVIEGFSAFETALTREGLAGSFCYGDAPSMADICLVPQVYNARRFAVDLAPFPTLVRIADHAAAQPAFREAAPENQPDAVQ